MPATINKQRVLTQLFTIDRKQEPAEPEPLPVLEQLLYAVCRQGTTRDRAEQSFRNLRDRFFDWNEVRVSSTREIEEALDDLPDGEVRAQRLIGLLQEVFETTFSFDLDGLHKKGVKQAAKHLARYAAANDYIVAWVVQQALGGHAVPLDAQTMRVLRRLGLIEGDENDVEALRASLEHLVPKSKGSLFVDLMSTIADEVCLEAEPRCAACPLASECATGQEVLRTAADVPERTARSKPR